MNPFDEVPLDFVDSKIVLPIEEFIIKYVGPAMRASGWLVTDEQLLKAYNEQADHRL